MDVEANVATFVLIHGGNPGLGTDAGKYGNRNGGKKMRPLAQALAGYGHEVYRPSLTGYGSRAHLASPDLSMLTLSRDIAGLIEAEDLQRVILLGYSFGGLPVCGAASLVAERLAHLVFFDALVCEDGETVAQLAPDYELVFRKIHLRQ